MPAESVAIEVGLTGATRPHTSSICERSDCFASLVRARADDHKTIVLAVTNEGFVGFWRNLRCSMDALGVSRHAIVVGTDRAACEAAESPAVPCVVGDGVFWGEAAQAELERGKLKHGTAAYARLMHLKARPALDALRLGYNVLFTDTDVVWLRNPLAELRAAYGGAMADGSVDLLIQSDHDESNDAACTEHSECRRSHWCREKPTYVNGNEHKCEVEVCGGFWWLRASAAGEALLDGMFAQMEVMRKQDERIGEQPVLNFVLHRTPGLRWRVLPRDEYPNGASYFVRRKWPAALPVIVHNNWLAGYKKKRARFERHGMWLLGPNDAPECVEAAIAPPSAAQFDEILLHVNPKEYGFVFK